MNVKNIEAFYFSATGGTSAVIDGFLKYTGPAQKNCLTRNNVHANIPKSHLAVFAAPVYEGRIAPVIAERFTDITGNGGPAVVLVVYGNREYEDALIELCDIITKQGFVVISAGAFIAEHSAYSKLAAGRPDSDGTEIAARFGKAVIDKIASKRPEQITPKGNRPYRALRTFKATPDCSDECIECGLCVEKCPQRAIASESPQKTNPDLCMACLACIKYCPTKARKIPSEYRKKYDAFLEQFTTIRKEPELF